MKATHFLSFKTVRAKLSNICLIVRIYSYFMHVKSEQSSETMDVHDRVPLVLAVRLCD